MCHKKKRMYFQIINYVHYNFNIPHLQVHNAQEIDIIKVFIAQFAVQQFFTSAACQYLQLNISIREKWTVPFNDKCWDYCCDVTLWFKMLILLK